VGRTIDSFNARKIDEALQCVADEFEIDWSSSVGPLKGVYRGRGGAQTLWTLPLDLWTTVHWDPAEVIVVDDSRVIVVNRVQMRGRGTYVDDVEVQLWTVRDGQGGAGQALSVEVRGPRSRGAAGVGDVAGERRDPSPRRGE
jgi:hypothetical protein